MSQLRKKMQARQAFRILFSSACRTSLGQLSCICLLALTLTSSCCCSQSPQVKIKDRPEYKIKIKENWSPTKITLYRSSSSFNSFQPGDAVVELEGKTAVYNYLPALNGEQETIVTFADPKSGRVYIGLPYPFFAETKSGIFGVFVSSGSIRWEPSLVDMSVSSGGTKKAISRLENDIDLFAILWGPESFDFGTQSHMYTDLDTALGRGFFSGGGSAGGTPPPRILSINISGQTLEVNLKSSLDNSVGNVWVDMETRKVVKALRDGKTPPPPEPPWPTEPPSVPYLNN